MAGTTLRSQDSPRSLGRPDLRSPPVCAHTFLMSSRYSLIQTDSPHPAYLVIDHAYDDEPALHPATLPSGAPHRRPPSQRRHLALPRLPCTGRGTGADLGRAGRSSCRAD